MSEKKLKNVNCHRVVCLTFQSPLPYPFRFDVIVNYPLVRQSSLFLDFEKFESDYGFVSIDHLTRSELMINFGFNL